MTYNKLIELIGESMQEVLRQQHNVTIVDDHTWNFLVGEIQGQVTVQKSEGDEFLCLVLHLFVLPVPEKDKEAFFTELLSQNVPNTFAKFGIYEGFVLISVVFQEFSPFSRDFFIMILKRYIDYADKTRIDLGTRYFQVPLV
jgi:hypothetical protein